MSESEARDDSPSWDECAATWDDDPRVQGFGEAAFAALIDREGENENRWRGGRCLDFGAGTGQLARRLAPLCREVVAVDVSGPMLATLETKAAEEGIGNIVTLQVSIDAKSAAEQSALRESFALIVASSVCNFLPDFPATLCTLASLLSPGGLFVQWDWQQSAQEEDFGISPADLASAYETAGLELLCAERAFSLASAKGAMDVLMGIGQRARAQRG